MLPIGCVRFTRNCGKMYSRHLFLYGGLDLIITNCYNFYDFSAACQCKMSVHVYFVNKSCALARKSKFIASQTEAIIDDKLH